MTTPTAPAQATVWDDAHLTRAAFSHVISGADGFLRMRLDVDDPAEVWADACHSDVDYGPRITALRLDPSRIPAKAEANGWRFIIPGDSEWPASLDQLGTEAPIGLWVSGPAHLEAASQGRDAVAFAGPRLSTDENRALADKIGRCLADNAKTLITGLALGAQGHTLEAALDHGGRIVAATSGRAVFSGAAALSARIAESGALVSHRPFDVVATRDDYAQTMRVVAALADALVYCDAPARSTAPVALKTAAKLQRRLIVQVGSDIADLDAVVETFTSAADLLQVLDPEA
ncbi:DNA-processing protein DprA [Luteococcus sp.]|uniref:DNA-processing protein DprA n=1 Tax=Luteococcus sp. TaxID=1969402 RepID=UPI003736D7A1